MKKIILSLCAFYLIGLVHSQDLASIGKPNPLSVSGSLSINQIGYSSIGIDSRRDPYSFFASGSINFSIYGWSVPLSFTYSNQQSSFGQPFNQYSLNPTYKNYTGHFGFTSMTFSPYTLSGHIFLGAGLEASYDKWSSKAMYGRLRNAVQPTAEAPESGVYSRAGYGGQATYQHKGTNLDFSFFRGRDDFSSISFEAVDSILVTPEENLVFNLGATQQLFKKISLSATYALSALTADTRNAFQNRGGYRLYNNLGSFFNANATTSFYDAFKLGTTFLGTGYTLGLGYERVDPGYTSHGAYYFVNDLESYTVNGSKVFLGGKINFNASAGVQRDNLNGDKISTLRRLVGSATVGYNPSSRLNLSTSYSNFQTYTNIRSQFVTINELTPFDNLDTLDFQQISQSVTATVNYVVKQSEKQRQNLGLNATVQNAADEQGDEALDTGNQFYLVSGNYSISFVPQKLNASLAVNYNRSTTADLQSETLGPSLSVSKSLLENKMNLSGALSWNQSRTNSVSQGSVGSFRLGSRYQLKEKHNFNLNLTVVNRTSPTSETQGANYTELTATLGYSYSFSKSNFFSSSSENKDLQP